jgi:hypothetical protein
MSLYNWKRHSINKLFFSARSWQLPLFGCMPGIIMDTQINSLYINIPLNSCKNKIIPTILFNTINPLNKCFTDLPCFEVENDINCLPKKLNFTWSYLEHCRTRAHTVNSWFYYVVSTQLSFLWLTPKAKRTGPSAMIGSDVWWSTTVC